MENNEGKRIIEINGVKIEVDLRTAKKIDTFKIGDPVKVLATEYSTPQIYAGVIVGFAEFKSAPAIEVMILKSDYNGVDIQFITIYGGAAKQTHEICAFNEYESLFSKSHISDLFDRQIEKKRLEIEEIERKKKYFFDEFAKAFKEKL